MDHCFSYVLILEIIWIFGKSFLEEKTKSFLLLFLGIIIVLLENLHEIQKNGEYFFVFCKFVVKK